MLRDRQLDVGVDENAFRDDEQLDVGVDEWRECPPGGPSVNALRASLLSGRECPPGGPSVNARRAAPLLSGMTNS